MVCAAMVACSALESALQHLVIRVVVCCGTVQHHWLIYMH